MSQRIPRSSFGDERYVCGPNESLGIDFSGRGVYILRKPAKEAEG